MVNSNNAITHTTGVTFSSQSDDYLCDSACNYDYCIERLTYCKRMFVRTIKLMVHLSLHKKNVQGQLELTLLDVSSK